MSTGKTCSATLPPLWEWGSILPVSSARCWAGWPCATRFSKHRAKVQRREKAMTETVANAADVEEALRDVIDPELGINVVDLGLVYGIQLDANRHAVIDMTLTSAACPLTDVIEAQTPAAPSGLVDGFRINWVWMPPWGPDKITDDGREQLRALGFNV